MIVGLEVNYVKLNKSAVVPSYNSIGDAGLDMTAISVRHANGFIEYDTGLAIEIPDGFVGLLFPRSSISKYGLILANSVGVIDSTYRGAIKFRFKQTGDPIYDIGDKIGQLMIIPYPTITLKEVEHLSDSERGSGGFGSSGN